MTSTSQLTIILNSIQWNQTYRTCYISRGLFTRKQPPITTPTILWRINIGITTTVMHTTISLFIDSWLLNLFIFSFFRRSWSINGDCPLKASKTLHWWVIVHTSKNPGHFPLLPSVAHTGSIGPSNTNTSNSESPQKYKNK